MIHLLQVRGSHGILFLIKGEKNMKNILISVATATLLAGLTVSTISASTLCFDGNETNKSIDKQIWIDKASSATEANLTLIPDANYKGASITVEFTNGGINVDKKQLMCVGNTKVGSLQEPGDTITQNSIEIATTPRYSFVDDDSISDLIEKDSNITFKTGDEDNCSTATVIQVIPLANSACQTIAAKIIKGKSTQSEDIPSAVTNEATFGTTAQAIKISATVPVCFVDNMTQLTDKSQAAGINLKLSDETQTATTNGGAPTFPSSCNGITLAPNQTQCITRIQVRSDAPESDLNISTIKLTANFIDSEGNPVTPTQSVYIEGNTSYSLGATQLIGANMSENNQTITFAFVTDGTNPVTLGRLQGTLAFDDNNSKKLNTEFNDINLTYIKAGLQTRFTVPYMYNTRSVSNFVKISTTLGSSDVTLSATITDNEGNVCPDVALRDIPGNGGSTFVWANGLDNPDRNFQPLIPSGECSMLTGNQYSVVFSTSASVNVVSYMRTSTGERTVIPF